MNNVRIYTIDNCMYCTQLKNILTTEGIEYTEINVNLPENEAEYKKLNEFTKSDDVPIVKVGKQILVPKISFQSIQECYQLTKKFLI